MKVTRLINWKGEPTIITTESFHTAGHRKKRKGVKNRIYKSRRLNRLRRKGKK